MRHAMAATLVHATPRTTASPVLHPRPEPRYRGVGSHTPNGLSPPPRSRIREVSYRLISLLKVGDDTRVSPHAGTGKQENAHHCCQD